MEYQKIINFVDITVTQPSKLRLKSWVEINNNAHGMYNTNSQVKFKTTILKLCFCDFSDA